VLETVVSTDAVTAVVRGTYATETKRDDGLMTDVAVDVNEVNCVTETLLVNMVVMALVAVAVPV